MAVLCAETAPAGAMAQLLRDRDRYLGYLSRRVGRAVAEDILQTALLRMLERGISVHDESRLAGWFYRVLRNAAIDHVRANARRARLRCEYAAQPVDATGEPAYDATALALVAQLDPVHREALEVVYRDGGSLAQLAERAGISRNAAAVRVHRARLALVKLVSSPHGALPCRPRMTSSPTASTTSRT